jgi:hypothetical protein
LTWKVIPDLIRDPVNKERKTMPTKKKPAKKVWGPKDRTGVLDPIFNRLVKRGVLIDRRKPKAKKK